MLCKQSEDLLARYQFAFDDETVDYDLIAQLLKYICESAYEEVISVTSKPLRTL
jgi:hypothetical protein